MRHKVKVGIIGLGYMGSIHYKKLMEIKGCELCAVFDIDESRYSLVTAKDVVRCSKYEEMKDLVDAVVISSPTKTHLGYLKYFLVNKIHCLCEKPPVVKYSDLKRLISIAKRNNLVFNVVMPERENPIVNLICDKTRKKGMAFMSDRVATYTTRSTDSSVLYDIMIHDIDIMRNIMPSGIKKIFASGLELLSSNLDALNVRIEFIGGAFGILNASRISTEKKRKIKVFFDGGYISADLIRKEYHGTLIKNGKLENISGDINCRVQRDPIKIIDADFIDSVATNKKEGKYSATTLLDVLKLCNRIEKLTIYKRPL